MGAMRFLVVVAAFALAHGIEKRGVDTDTSKVHATQPCSAGRCPTPTISTPLALHRLPFPRFRFRLGLHLAHVLRSLCPPPRTHIPRRTRRSVPCSSRLPRPFPPPAPKEPRHDRPWPGRRRFDQNIRRREEEDAIPDPRQRDAAAGSLRVQACVYGAAGNG